MFLSAGPTMVPLLAYLDFYAVDLHRGPSVVAGSFGGHWNFYPIFSIEVSSFDELPDSSSSSGDVYSGVFISVCCP